MNNNNDKSNTPLLRLILLLAAITAISPLAVDVYLPAMPAISGYFAVNISLVQQSMSLYLAGFSLGMLIFGPLVDHMNRKYILYFGLAGFIVISLMIALSSSITQFLMLRFIQAFCGSVSAVVIPSYIRQVYGDNTAKGMSYVLFVMMLAPLIAPAVGSIILSISNWQFIFLFLMGYGILLLPFIFFKKMPNETHNQKHKINISIFKNYLFVIKKPGIFPQLCASGMAGFAFFGYLTASPIIYMEVFQLEHSSFSLLFAVNVIALMIANFTNGQIVEKYGARSLLKIATFLNIIVCLTFIFTTSQHLHILSILLIIPMVGLLSMISVNADAIVIMNFTDEVGSASALIGIIKFAMGALSGPLLGFFYNNSALPFALLIFFATSIILLCNTLLTRHG